MIVATNPNQVKANSPRPTAAEALWLAYFILSVAVIGFIDAYVCAAPFYLLGYLWPAANKVGDRILRIGVRLLLSAQPWLNAEVELDFAAHELKGCLLVSNHRSHLDAFLLLSRIQGLRLLAKRSLFSVPGLGWLMRLSGQIPAKSGDIRSFMDAMNKIRDRISRGETVHVFPELTRCPGGFKGLLAFSRAPFMSRCKRAFMSFRSRSKGRTLPGPKRALASVQVRKSAFDLWDDWTRATTPIPKRSCMKRETVFKRH